MHSTHLANPEHVLVQVERGNQSETVMFDFLPASTNTMDQWLGDLALDPNIIMHLYQAICVIIIA